MATAKNVYNISSDLETETLNFISKVLTEVMLSFDSDLFTPQSSISSYRSGNNIFLSFTDMLG